MKNKKSAINLTSSIAILIVSVIVIILAFLQQSDTKNQQINNTKEIKKEVRNVIKENLTKSSNFPDYDSLSSLKKVNLVSNFISWTPQSNIDQDKARKILVLEKGQLTKAYVYIKASLDNKALTQWESIYLTLNWTGGHLFRPQSLLVPPSDKTELLYAVNYIPFLSIIPYNEQNTPTVVDWFPYFSDGSSIQVDIFISSLRPALLEDISIYYQCVKSSECLLTVR